MTENAINWFEIPVADMDRAMKFYGTILEKELSLVSMDGNQMAMIPVEDGAVGGGLFKDEDAKPATTGTRVYLNGGDDLTTVLNRVEAAGGKITLPKTNIGENGFMAFFIDTEGNRVGLHSMK